ncbi:RNA polymerase sigma factor [Flavilitoribacter nigricans]|uniref:Sigma-70 family RNA polymerase sigma factor n=1 Tax=Flavilitoribacter nigricans (strain ATCC 23147 / DSM 23189 / NBRC 102662 / NCIMB 1420 / SS-2) TaxID=1122177 RepID=A0A2D0NBQ3_FLAN2|nr:sigma-70 family RNA polymerase sigma factor [Flavilitoribacter nigricans]PHN05203.1 hypothetical protein CRP01_16930 [Flavilitoribacter nigricans DSM 23189 = NBRC 102662]
MYSYSDCQARQSSRLLAQTYYQRADTRILAILFHRYRASVFRICCSYLNNRMEAEDATMEIFEMLPDQLGRYRIRNFSYWFRQFSRNHCRRRLRRQPPRIWSNAFGPLSEEQSSEAKLRMEKRIEQLYLGLDQLKQPQRNCIVGYYFEELSYREIAQKLELSTKAVKSHIQNGKRNLRNFCLKPCPT